MLIFSCFVRVKDKLFVAINIKVKYIRARNMGYNLHACGHAMLKQTVSGIMHKFNLGYLFSGPLAWVEYSRHKVVPWSYTKVFSGSYFEFYYY